MKSLLDLSQQQLLCPHTSARSVSFLPVLEEASEAEGHQLQSGLDHEGGGEEVVAVLQRGLQRLRREPGSKRDSG